MKLLDAQQVLELHEYVLVRDGGLPGIRAGKSVDAVLARIENNLLFEFDPDAANAAALVTYAFAVGHIFNDANNRTAYVCGLITLEINGVKTNKLEDVIKAIAESKDAKHVIKFMGEGSFECLDRKAAEKAHTEILATYGIREDRRL